MQNIGLSSVAFGNFISSWIAMYFEDWVRSLFAAITGKWRIIEWTG